MARSSCLPVAARLTVRKTTRVYRVTSLCASVCVIQNAGVRRAAVASKSIWEVGTVVLLDESTEGVDAEGVDQVLQSCRRTHLQSDRNKTYQPLRKMIFTAKETQAAEVTSLLPWSR